MIRLFNDQTETYTQEGLDIDQEILDLLRPVVQGAVDKNVALRDLHYILEAAVDQLVSSALLNRNATFWRKPRKDVQ